MERLPLEMLREIGKYLDTKSLKQFSLTGKRYHEGLLCILWRHPRFRMVLPEVLNTLINHPIHHLETGFFIFVDLVYFTQIHWLQVLELNHFFGNVSIQDLENMVGKEFRLILHTKTLAEDIRLNELGVTLRKLKVTLLINHSEITGRVWTVAEMLHLADLDIEKLLISSLCIDHDFGKLFQLLAVLKPRELFLQKKGCCNLWLKEDILTKLGLYDGKLTISSLFLFNVTKMVHFVQFGNLTQFFLMGRDIVNMRWLEGVNFSSVSSYIDTYWNILHKTIRGERSTVIKYMIPHYFKELYSDYYVLNVPISFNFKNYVEIGIIIDV